MTTAVMAKILFKSSNNCWFYTPLLHIFSVEPSGARGGLAPVHRDQGEEAGLQPDGQPGAHLLHKLCSFSAITGQEGGDCARPGGAAERAAGGKEDWQSSHNWI